MVALIPPKRSFWLCPLWAFLCLLGACASTTQATPEHRAAAQRRRGGYKAQIQSSIDALIQAQDPCLHMGVQVMGLADQQVLYERRANERFVPASTVKLLTASTALNILGPSYRFPTQLFVDNFDPATGLARTLFLRGSGDPTLDVGDLAALVNALKQAGVKAISGELVVDDSDFDGTPWAQGWMWDDLDSSFSAPVWGLNVAGNAVAVWAMPGGQKGAAARVLRVPEAEDYLMVSNSAVTTAAKGSSTAKIAVQDVSTTSAGPPAPSSPNVNGPVDVALAKGQEVAITGLVPLDAPPKLRTFAIRDPVAWAGALMGAELRRAGILVPVSVRRGTVSATAWAVALHESAPLGTLLPQFVKASNNHAMECVLKRISVAAYGAPGTFLGGTQAVRRHLIDMLGAQGADMNLADGSGASRYNLVTPAQLSRAVCAGAKTFGQGPELVSSLPVAGVDGTLQQRLVGTFMQGRVRAKTGTMTGVSSLAGLLQAEDGETLCFSIMMDGALMPADGLRRLQDTILLVLGQRPVGF